MDVSRETPDVTTKPKCYDLTNILVLRLPRAVPELSFCREAPASRATELGEKAVGPVSEEAMFKLLTRMVGASLARKPELSKNIWFPANRARTVSSRFKVPRVFSPIKPQSIWINVYIDIMTIPFNCVFKCSMEMSRIFR